MTSEQRPPVNNGHYFWVLRVAVVHRFDCSIETLKTNLPIQIFCVLPFEMADAGQRVDPDPDLGLVSFPETGKTDRLRDSDSSKALGNYRSLEN